MEKKRKYYEKGVKRLKVLKKKKPLVFLASSNLIQLLKAKNDLEKNGFNVYGPDCEGGLDLLTLGNDMEMVKRCDSFIFFTDTEMSLWQCTMLGVALSWGKRIDCIKTREKDVEGILNLPQIYHYRSWNDLMEKRYTLRKEFVLKRIAALRTWISRLRKKSRTEDRVKRIKQMSIRKKELIDEYNRRFVYGKEK